MYEERSSFDWKGLFLKVIIAFLIVLIAFKAYSTLKGNNNNKVDSNTKTETIAKSKTSSTFTANLEKLKKAGESYFTNNKDQLPTVEGNTVMVTLKDLINSGEITELVDEDGKNCDGESTYVSATLDGKDVKIKANLVCGDAFSYALVHMGENDSKVEETKSSSSKTTSGNNYSSTSSSTNNTVTKSTSSSCGTTTCGTPSVSVNTSTNVSSNVNIKSEGTKATTSNTPVKTSTPVKSTTNYANYTTDTVLVSFDSNGGSRTYASQRVVIGDTAYNPGTTSKSGYTFIGWYLNGYKYDFSTPVDRNITLVAKYSRNSNYYYDDDYYYDDYYYDDYYYNNSAKITTSTSVYTMAWDSYDKYQISVSHTLALPSINESYRQIRIKKIEYVKPINTTSLAETFRSKHSSTFLYTANGWESYNDNSNSFATISNAVFYYDTNYKSRYEAASEGFNVTWTSTNISKRCYLPFNVTSSNGYTAEKVCNYGIVYRVTWEYIK